MSAGSPVVSDLFDRVGGHPEDLTGPLVTEAARDGDPLARELLSEIGRWLGIGMADLAAALDPGTFVIGAGSARPATCSSARPGRRSAAS